MYSEPVTAAAGASEYASLALSTGGATRTVDALSGDATDTHVITFAGDAAAANATGMLTLDETGLADDSDNALGTDGASAQRVADGQAPRILSANITAANTVTVVYSEPVTAAAGASEYASLALSTGGATRTVDALSGDATDTHVLTFSGAAAAANATGTLTLDETGLADDSDNALGTDGASAQPVADGQAPRILSANLTAANTVTVVYTEPVTAAAGASEYASLALSTGGATRTVDALSGDATDTHVLTFSGAAAAANATGTLTLDETGLADDSDNALGTDGASAQPVADGQAPRILSANITAANTVTVVYTEPVTAAAGASEYASLALSTGGATRTVDALSGDATDTHVLTFSGAAAAANATGTLTLDETGLADDSDNALGTDGASAQPVADGQAPKVLSANITAANTVTVVYTEPVTAAAGASEYASLALTPGGTRTVDALSGDATDTHVITFAGDAAAANATGMLTLDQTALADASGNAIGPSTSFAQRVADGQAPKVLSANITASNTVTVVYSEPVTAAAGASELREPGAVHGRRHPHRRRPVRRRDRHARTHVQRRRGRGERHRNADAGRDRAGRRLRQRPWNRRGVRAAGRRRPGAPDSFRQHNCRQHRHRSVHRAGHRGRRGRPSTRAWRCPRAAPPAPSTPCPATRPTRTYSRSAAPRPRRTPPER